MDLSIVLTTLNTETLIKKSLETIFSDIDELKSAYEIIVIDNASEDNTVKILEKEFPAVRLIANKTNRGAAPARNQGILTSSGRYLLFLDADTFITSKAIATMLQVIKSSADYGAVGCRLFFADKRPQPSVGIFPTLSSELFQAFFLHKLFKGKSIERFTLNGWNDASQREVDWLSLACLLARHQTIDSVGLLDERYFYGAEDSDWCYRMWEKSWKVVFTPEADAIHLGGQSIKTVRSQIYDKPYRGKLLFFEKRYGKQILPMVRAIALLDALTNLVVWSGVYMLSSAKRERAKTFIIERAFLLRDIILRRI